MKFKIIKENELGMVTFTTIFSKFFCDVKDVLMLCQKLNICVDYVYVEASGCNIERLCFEIKKYGGCEETDEQLLIQVSDLEAIIKILFEMEVEFFLLINSNQKEKQLNLDAMKETDFRKLLLKKEADRILSVWLDESCITYHFLLSEENKEKYLLLENID